MINIKFINHVVLEIPELKSNLIIGNLYKSLKINQVNKPFFLLKRFCKDIIFF